MKKYISANLIPVIRNIYDKATRAVLFNSGIGDWFRTIAGVRQECLQSTSLFSIFLERIMTDALEDHEGTVSIGGRRNYLSSLHWWHRRLSRRGRRAGKTSWASRQSLHKLRHGDQCRWDQADDKQHQRHQYRYYSEWRKLESVTSFKYLG